MQIDQTKIEEAIVREAVDRFVNDDDLYSRVMKGVEARIDAIFADKVQPQVAAAVEQCVREGFDREYQKADSFGRAAGDKTSIRKELETLVQGYWTDRVDRNGKKTDSSYSSMSRAEWMMVQICADDFSKEMKQHVVNVSGALKDHFRGVLHQHIAVLLSDIFRVQTVQDREMGKPGASCIHPPAAPMA